MTRKKFIRTNNEILKKAIIGQLKPSDTDLPCSLPATFEKCTSIYHCFSNMNETRKESNDKVENWSTNWAAVLWYIYLHILGVFGLCFLFTRAQWMTVLYFLFLTITGSIGVTAGAHRLYAHQTFIASSQLRFFLILAHTLAGVGPLYNWVFWHRMHHKFYGTGKDPFNHKKGFLHAHLISNFVSAPSLEMYSRDIDMRDVDSDGFVWTQRKFYWILFIVFGLLLPINVPVEYWQESLLNSILIIGITRLAITVNISWLVNSGMLVWGLKEGDKFPVDDNSVFFISKSYWLNYHYLVPWDWKSDEFGKYETGFVTFIIKIWRELGLIQKMKTTNSEDVREALYKIASSKATINEALTELEEHATEQAHKEALIYHH